MHSHYIEPALFRVFENLFGLHKEQFKILISPLIHKVQNFQSKVNLDIKERKTKCVTRFIHKYSFIQHITIFLSFIHLNLFTFSNLIHWYHTHPTNIQHYIQQIFVFSFITFLSLLSLFLSFVQFRRVPFVFFFVYRTYTHMIPHIKKIKIIILNLSDLVHTTEHIKIVYFLLLLTVIQFIVSQQK